MRIAIQGEQGSFHHLAAKHWYEEDFTCIPCETFADVFSALEDDRADEGIIAIENSLYGSINEVYDLLDKYRYPIIGEVSERIHQQLAGLPDAKLENIKTVMSHPVALAQCSDFLDKRLPRAKRVEHFDTAGAIELVKRRGDKTLAAIGSSLAARQAGLQVLAPGIENDPRNYTRFVVIAKDGHVLAGADKASLVLQTSHQPGALYEALGIFAKAGINLTKLQSRPIAGKVWRYQFYIDVEAAGNRLAATLQQLEHDECRVTVLGEYAAADTEYED